MSGDMSMGRVVGVARVGDPSRELERVVARPELRVLRLQLREAPLYVARPAGRQFCCGQRYLSFFEDQIDLFQRGFCTWGVAAEHSTVSLRALCKLLGRERRKQLSLFS